MTDLELFKQALNEGVSNHFDEIVYREEASEIIKEYAAEYAEEFSKATIAEVDEDFYTFVGDKHYFEFELVDGKLQLNSITEIVYW